MQRFISISGFGFLSLLVLSGCGRFYKYDSTVTSEQRSLIEKDMSRISDVQMTARSADDLKILQIADLSGSTIKDWLQRRNRIVVGEDYDWVGNSQGSQKVNQVPQLLTSAQTDFANGLGAGGTVTVMVNLGAAIYLQGVKNNVIYTVEAGGESVRIWSPRAAGLIQVGEGLFNTLVSGGDMESWAHSIRRSSTYVHEATHVDGNGDHRAFAHAECPAGYYRTEFQGEYACENYLNGPYSRQVVFLSYAIAQLCPEHGCNSAEQDALLKTMSDYDSRKLSGASYVDPTPEGYGVAATGSTDFRIGPQLSEIMLK